MMRMDEDDDDDDDPKRLEGAVTAENKRNHPSVRVGMVDAIRV